MSINDIQKAAFTHLRDPDKANFANPLVGATAAITNSMGNLGGLDFSGFEAKITQAVDNAKITQIDADDIRSELSPLGFSVVSSAVDSLTASIGEQTTTVVNDLARTISTVNSYGSLSEQFGVAVTLNSSGDVDDDQLTTDVCTSIKDVIGSLSGAADELYASAQTAIASISDAINNLSATVKGYFQAAQTAIDGILASTGAVVTDVKNALNSFVTNISNTIKSEIASLVDEINTHLDDVKDMIDKELTILNEITEYIKSAAISLSFPALDPCAKEAVAACAGAAGATPLVDLVTQL